jgi:hypothetical protein
MQPRESSFRNIYGEVFRKEVSYTDVKVNKSAAQLIKANATLFAVPWTTAFVLSASIKPASALGKILSPLHSPCSGYPHPRVSLMTTL